jgi:hypothetical protein
LRVYHHIEDKLKQQKEASQNASNPTTTKRSKQTSWWFLGMVTDLLILCDKCS